MTERPDSVPAIDWSDLPPGPCPVSSALALFGDRWSMLIIRDVMNGVHRFDDLVNHIEVSRATLSARLRKLTEAGVIVPSDYEDAHGRVRTEYRLSESGWDLQNVLTALREWGDKHVFGEGNEPLRLVDKRSGRDVRLAVIDDATGVEVSGSDIRLAPGPSFDNTYGSGPL